MAKEQPQPADAEGGKQKGKHAGYRQTTFPERLLAVLRIESGIPVEAIAADFGLSTAGAQTWLRLWAEGNGRFRQSWRTPIELTPHELAAGYAVGRGRDIDGRPCDTVKRGRRWSPERVAAAIPALALKCFLAAMADTRNMTAPSKATVLAIGRVYRQLDPANQALHAPAWDQCQIAVDEIGAGRERLRRAAALVEALQTEVN